MQHDLVQEISGDAPMHPESEILVAQTETPCTLYITLGPDGGFKAGTCAHCVIAEHGRPERAWDANGDSELDFDRDTLFAHLSDLGIVLTHRQAYVCP